VTITFDASVPREELNFLYGHGGLPMEARREIERAKEIRNRYLMRDRRPSRDNLSAIALKRCLERAAQLKQFMR